MSCLPCSVVGTSSARRFAPVARSFRVLWLCEWRRTPRASTSEVGRLPRLRWPATDGLGQTRLGTMYSAPASKLARRKRLSPGRSAPPPTAGGVKLLFRCLAPHEAVIPLDCKAELWKRKELWKRRAHSKTNTTKTERSVACWLKFKLPESGLQHHPYSGPNPCCSLRLIRACRRVRAPRPQRLSAAGPGRAAPAARILSAARAGVRACLNPSGCPPRGWGAPPPRAPSTHSTSALARRGKRREAL